MSIQAAREVPHASWARPTWPTEARGTLSLEEWQALAAIDRASLALLEQRELQQRTDTKFVLPRAWLADLLDELAGSYRVLFAAESPVARYVTRYYDTASFDLFNDHRRGRRKRFKVRVRHYPERELSYLEIKGRAGGDETHKWRRERPYLSEELSSDDTAFIAQNARVDGRALSPVLVNRFHRVTLIGVSLPERITFDMGVRFNADGEEEELPRVLIAEVKQARLSRQSPLLRALGRRGARPESASKYCIGALLLYPHLRGNRLLPSLRALGQAGRC
jgi:hypothetical protein